MITKQCFKCGAEKELGSFYKHPEMTDGHVNKCKTCNKNDVQKNYRKNIEHYVEYERKRFKDPKRKEKIKIYATKRRKSFPGKSRARQKLNNSIRAGKIVRHPCEVCGDEKSQGHHTDYRKPLEVTWLCFKHHREAHNQITH